MGSAGTFIFSKPILRLVAIGASARLHARQQNLAIRRHTDYRHTGVLYLPSSRSRRRRRALIDRSGTVKSRSNQKPVKYRFSICLFCQRMYRVNVSLQIKTRLRVSIAIDTQCTVNWLDGVITPGPSRDLAEDIPDHSVLRLARAVAWHNGAHVFAIFSTCQR